MTARRGATDQASTRLHLLPSESQRRLRRGEALFRQGDPADCLFGVASGRLRLLRHTAEGREVAVATARAGEMLAEAALFADTYHCDAVADVASRVEVYRCDGVRSALRDDPELALRWVAHLARQVQTLRGRLEIRNIRSARERVVAYLSVAPRAGAGDRPLRELAVDLGLAPEVLYRTLATLEAEGAVVRDGRSVVLSESAGPLGSERP